MSVWTKKDSASICFLLLSNMYRPDGHLIYRQAGGCLNAKRHPGLHMGVGQTDVRSSVYQANGPVKFDETRLSSVKFNPLIPGNSNLALSSDLDPDSNFDFTVNIIQNTNLMNYWTKLALLVIPFSFRYSI